MTQIPTKTRLSLHPTTTFVSIQFALVRFPFVTSNPLNLLHLRKLAKAHCQNGKLDESPKVRRPTGADEGPPLHRRRQGDHQEDRPRLPNQHRSQGLSLSILHVCLNLCCSFVAEI